MAAVKKIPLRKCTGCGEMKPKKELVRVIKTAEEQILLDLTGRMNGRGAYVCREEECLKKAIKTKAIERSLGVSVSDEVYEQLKKELGE
ncbi:MAG: YlxR family protein [Lachnospiraceae bacterium]|nr:YlxR family protein [Lachnospiraceae bacterium]MEE0862231.1 YlxR family protein [Lachnospiraceae bacterium]